MEFIDRIKEQKRLHRAIDASERKFIVVYGRPRLGKSTLLKRVLGDNDVYFEAGKQETQVQVSLLAGTIANYYAGFDQPIYPSWSALLTAFNGVCRENTVLVLDEFPYMVEKDDSLPSARRPQRFQSLWLPLPTCRMCARRCRLARVRKRPRRRCTR